MSAFKVMFLKCGCQVQGITIAISTPTTQETSLLTADCNCINDFHSKHPIKSVNVKHKAC